MNKVNSYPLLAYVDSNAFYDASKAALLDLSSLYKCFFS
jgi:hypothetical protein